MGDAVDPRDDEAGESGPMRKAKGRWALTEEGRIKMEEAYAASRFPNSAVRERLCKEVGGSMRQIQVWFQNRRQRDKLQYREWPNMPIVVMNHPNMPAGYYANGSMISPMMGPPGSGPMMYPGADPNMMAGGYPHPGMMMPGMPPGVPMPYTGTRAPTHAHRMRSCSGAHREAHPSHCAMMRFMKSTHPAL